MKWDSVLLPIILSSLNWDPLSQAARCINVHEAHCYCFSFMLHTPSSLCTVGIRSDISSQNDGIWWYFLYWGTFWHLTQTVMSWEMFSRLWELPFESCWTDVFAGAAVQSVKCRQYTSLPEDVLWGFVLRFALNTKENVCHHIAQVLNFWTFFFSNPNCTQTVRNTINNPGGFCGQFVYPKRNRCQG